MSPPRPHRRPTHAIRVVIAAPYRLQRAGARSLIERTQNVRVVGEAGDGREVLRLVARKKPDLVIMDIAMPLLNGVATTARLSKQYPEVRVIVVSPYKNGGHAVHALRAGAAGYLVKDADPAELDLAIRRVAGGGSYVSASAKASRSGPTPFERLTPRQREVLQLIAEGSNTKEIASSLGISVKTVETHRAHLMSELDIHDVAGLVRYAIRIGVASVER